MSSTLGQGVNGVHVGFVLGLTVCRGVQSLCCIRREYVRVECKI